MTTTAHEDQFTTTPEPLRQPYDTRNVADLEIALRKQTERAESYAETLRSIASYVGAGGYNADTVDAGVFEEKIRWGIGEIMKRMEKVEAELAKARDQKPVGYIPVTDFATYSQAAMLPVPWQTLPSMPLYSVPVPTMAAPAVPEELLKCWLIESPASSDWPAIWLTITTDGRRWVSDGGTMYATGGDWYFTSAASEALKFAEKESADEYIRHNKIKDVVVTEHIFDNRTLLQSAEVKR